MDTRRLLAGLGRQVGIHSIIGSPQEKGGRDSNRVESAQLEVLDRPHRQSTTPPSQVLSWLTLAMGMGRRMMDTQDVSGQIRPVRLPCKP